MHICIKLAHKITTKTNKGSFIFTTVCWVGWVGWGRVLYGVVFFRENELILTN